MIFPASPRATEIKNLPPPLLGGRKRDVADPWFTDDYEKTYEDIVKGCRAVLEKLS